MSASSGRDRIRTCGLKVMSLASYQTAPPCVSVSIIDGCSRKWFTLFWIFSPIPSIGLIPSPDGQRNRQSPVVAHDNGNTGYTQDIGMGRSGSHPR